MNKLLIVGLACFGAIAAHGQTFDHYVTTDSLRWQKAKAVKAEASAKSQAVEADANAPIVTFRNWGTTFNEQDWKALCMLARSEQDEILERAFSPSGELHFGIGRISMNANDYALASGQKIATAFIST